MLSVGQGLYPKYASAQKNKLWNVPKNRKSKLWVIPKNKKTNFGMLQKTRKTNFEIWALRDC
jgi:hypothetical protein